ncbi:atlastin-2-like [Clavelina lepadiformis]|uniref:atlastin-2-like n=1 Tax=Clavelina lepadiformis TaxID=159417 RepID=UPI0040436395
MSSNPLPGTSPRVVNIVKEENKRLVLDKNALRSVLLDEEVADLPVAIYSAAGVFRMGKSLLLDLFVRYMETGELCENISDNDVIKGPFAIQGGALDACTNGIYILRKPFSIATKEHRKVAVFLMDTQGMFDHSASTEVTGDIMGFSLLLSSYQFYNLSQNISSDHLTTIYKFADFARKLQNINQSDSPFQRLMFLIRDWKKLRSFPLGLDGGEKFLKEVLQNEERGSEEHKDIQSLLQQTFEKMSCFLLPSSGDVVEAMEKEDTSCLLKDISLDFRKEASYLFEHFCHPDNICLKILDNREVSCRQLYNHAVHLDLVLASGLVSSVDSYVKATQRGASANLIHDLVLQYRQETDYSSQNKDENLDELHIFKKNMILQEYDGKACGGEDLKREGRQKLAFKIEQQFTDVKHKNCMAKIVDQCFNYYQDKMLQWKGTKLEDLENEHQRLKDESRKKFDDLEKPEGEYFQVRAKDLLENKIERFYQRTKIRVNTEIVLKEVLEEYTAGLKKRSHLNLNRVLRSKHHKLVWESLKKIEEELPPGRAAEIYEKFLGETKTFFADVKKRNLKWRIGSGIGGTIVGGAAIAAAAVLPPLLPAMVAAEASTALLVTGLIAGGAVGGGAAVGVPTGLFLGFSGSSNFDFKKSLVTAGLLPLKVSLPDASALIDEEVFISAMMMKQERNNVRENSDEIAPTDSIDGGPSNDNDETHDCNSLLRLVQ